MLGHPKFDYGDKVQFEIYFGDDTNELVNLIGTVAIIDKYGTFADDSDVSYDVVVEGIGLFKHISERGLRRVVAGS